MPATEYATQERRLENLMVKSTIGRAGAERSGRTAVLPTFQFQQLSTITMATVALILMSSATATATLMSSENDGQQRQFKAGGEDLSSIEYRFRSANPTDEFDITSVVNDDDVRGGQRYDGMMSDASSAPEEVPATGISRSSAIKSQCLYPCNCQRDPPRCKMGSTIKDGCNCCHICPRQQGDLCDHKFQCDEDRGLYCDFALDEGHRGICRAKSARSCEVDGKTYKDGEEVRSCKEVCTCQNGQYACASLCPQEDRPPSKNHCREAQLVSIAGQCCREWVCPHAHSLPQPDDADQLGSSGLTSTAGAERCVKETTEWSPCSVTCGMGVSTRLTNNNKECQSKQEQQLCLIRPCNLNDKNMRPSNAKGGKCQSTMRGQEINLQYRNCFSVEQYRPKYCTTCKKNRCCGPGKTKTRDITFRCPDGKRIVEKFMWIASCECKPSKTCPYTVTYDDQN